MTTVLLDPGHGGSDPGATYRNYEEEDFTLTIALLARQHLLEHYQVNVLMTRTDDRTVGLSERSSMANRENVDFFCSIHINAGGGTGFESYVYNGGASPRTIQYRSVIHDQIMSVIGPKYSVKDRGKKSANFHVLRETKMPAVLLETLFIDHSNDIKLLTSSDFMSDYAASLADGIGKALNLPRKSTRTTPTPQPSPAAGDRMYKVIAGSFKNRENAEKLINELKGKNVDSFLSAAMVDGASYFRVQTGAFKNLQNAKDQLARLVQLGYKDAFILTPAEQGTAQSGQKTDSSRSSTPQPKTPSPDSRDIPILGETLVSGTILDLYVEKTNPSAPQLGDLYEQLSKSYGIRGDIAFAQAIHETNYFRFTGVVNRNQNNFAGIGATGPNVTGASFSTPREGVLAHLQHLYAYATTKPLPAGFPLVDPRFIYVERGSAPTWKDLNGKWAVPGSRYGEMILSIYLSILQFAIQQLNAAQSAISKQI